MNLDGLFELAKSAVDSLNPPELRHGALDAHTPDDPDSTLGHGEKEVVMG